MTTIKTAIPFEGFYESTYDASIDDELEQMRYEMSTDDAQKFTGLVYRYADFAAMRLAIAREYVKAINGAIEGRTDLSDDARAVRFEFAELTSPREYNFETDRIICRVTPEHVKAMRDSVDGAALRDQVRENHSSRDGFISFYPNDLDEWPQDVAEWDLNQIGTLVQCFLCTVFDTDDLNQALKAYELCADLSGNGVISNIVCDNLGDVALNFLNAEYEARDGTA